MKYILPLLISLALGACDVIPPPQEDSGEQQPTTAQPAERRIERATSGDFKALHLPSETPEGVLILLHGYGSNPEDIIALGRRLRADWEVWAPQAPIEIREGHYSWFELSTDDEHRVTRGNEETSLGEWADKLHSFALEKKRHGIPLVIAGFSQGAAVAMVLATRDSPEIAGVAALSGWLPQTEASIHPNREYFVSHGDLDRRIGVEEARKLEERLNPDRTRFRIYTGMRHTVSATVLNDMRGWLQQITERPEFN